MRHDRDDMLDPTDSFWSQVHAVRRDLLVVRSAADSRCGTDWLADPAPDAAREARRRCLVGLRDDAARLLERFEAELI